MSKKSKVLCLVTTLLLGVIPFVSFNESVAASEINTSENVSETSQELYNYLSNSQYVFKEFDKDGNTVFTIYDSDLELMFEEQGLNFVSENGNRVKRGEGVTKLVWHSGFMNVDAYMSKTFLNNVYNYAGASIIWKPIVNAIRAFEGKDYFQFKHGRVYRVRGGAVSSWDYQ